MKLSEAIREGCKLNGQAFCTLKDLHGNTCVLGAAYEGVFGTLPDNISSFTAANMLETEGMPMSKMVCIMDNGEWRKFNMRAAMQYLNDYCRWSRERIADVLDELEKAKSEGRKISTCHLGPCVLDWS